MRLMMRRYNLNQTWSLKYNLAWDKYLKMNIYPEEVMREEIAYYKLRAEAYGPPLDNRIFLKVGPISKWDWTSWIAAISGAEDFQVCADCRESAVMSVAAYADCSGVRSSSRIICSNLRTRRGRECRCRTGTIPKQAT